MRLPLILLLAVSAFWEVAADEVDVEEVMEAPPIQELFLFDISTRRSQPSTLKNAFADVNVTVYNSFKVTGKRRHLFLVEDNGALRDVDMPEDADVTVYPVEHATDYAGLFGVKLGKRLLSPLPDGNLTFVERTCVRNGKQSSETSRPASVVLIRDVQKTFVSFEKVFFFMNLKPNGVARVHLTSNDAYGGPGAVNVVVHRIHNI
nr:hypothetical protein BaRGS_011906 [Batillaria attramentaria]